VFQKVEVSIKVREGRAGTRRLVIGLVANGRDFAADAGTYTSTLLYLHKITIAFKRRKRIGIEITWFNFRDSQFLICDTVSVLQRMKRTSQQRQGKLWR
jgi:hypothetical protein